MGDYMEKQKSMTHRILEIVAVYLLFFLAENFIIAGIYCMLCPRLSFGTCYLHSLQGTILELTSNEYVGIIYVAQNLILMVAGTVMTGFVFQQVANKQPRIVLHEKMIIRRRTEDGLPVVNVMLCNWERRFLYDVRCTITCYFSKTSIISDHVVYSHMDGQHVREDKTAVVQNFYRFGFPFKSFPKEFLDHYINRPKGTERDYIFVVISGTINHFGHLQPFRTIKKYGIRDIIIGEYAERFDEKKRNPLTGKEKDVILWDQILTYVDVSEESRFQIVEEIRQLIKK